VRGWVRSSRDAGGTGGLAHRCEGKPRQDRCSLTAERSKVTFGKRGERREEGIREGETGEGEWEGVGGGWGSGEGEGRGVGGWGGRGRRGGCEGGGGSGVGARECGRRVEDHGGVRGVMEEVT